MDLIKDNAVYIETVSNIPPGVYAEVCVEPSSDKCLKTNVPFAKCQAGKLYIHAIYIYIVRLCMHAYKTELLRYILTF